MNKAEIELVTEMIDTALSSEDGVSEETYNCIRDLADVIKDEKLDEILSHVDGTDGNFYLPDDY